jgi:HSP20 family protein
MIHRRSALSEFERLHEQMDQMWRRLAGVPAGRSRFCSPMLAPPTDVYETEDEIVVVAEIAGIEGQEVAIEIDGDRLTFHGEKVDREAHPNQRHTQMEICYGVFGRTVVLPARVESTSPRVSYAGGFLRIVLPKLSKEAPHRVRVNVEKPSD